MSTQLKLGLMQNATERKAPAWLRGLVGKARRRPRRRTNITSALALVASAERATWFRTFISAIKGTCSTVAGSGELTMGSLTAEGMVRLLSNMPPACQLSSHSTFLDIGSGVGQLPLFIRAATSARAIGVEIDKCRHEAAVRRHESIRGALPAGDGLSYVRADVRNTGLYNATHVFLHSTCFGDELSRQIVRLATSATAVRCVLDLNDASDIERARSFAPFGSPVATTTLSSSGAPLVYFLRHGLQSERSAAGAASAMAVLRRAGRRDRAAIDDSCGAHRPPMREAKMKRSRNDGGGDPSLG